MGCSGVKRRWFRTSVDYGARKGIQYGGSEAFIVIFVRNSTCRCGDEPSTNFVWSAVFGKDLEVQAVLTLTYFQTKGGSHYLSYLPIPRHPFSLLLYIIMNK